MTEGATLEKLTKTDRSVSSEVVIAAIVTDDYFVYVFSSEHTE